MRRFHFEKLVRALPMTAVTVGLTLPLVGGLRLESATPQQVVPGTWELVCDVRSNEELLPPRAIRAVSFNLHGPPSRQIDAVLDALRGHPALRQAGILALQEVNRDHPGSGNRDVAREIGEALGLNVLYAVEMKHEEGGVRGLALMSRFPLMDPQTFVLPVEGPKGRRRIALGATIRLGDRRVRVYTTHLETRISVEERSQQIQEIIRRTSDRHGMPLLVMGDFNTYNRSSVRKMFELMENAGFNCAIEGSQNTFQKYFVVRLKLDWIWSRDAAVIASGVETGISVSDHRPVWTDLRVD